MVRPQFDTVDMIRFSPASGSSKDSYTKTSFFNPQEELLLQSISSSSKQGLGYVNSSLIPYYCRNPINKIPENVEIPSGPEIVAFFDIKGISPYNPDDLWKKKNV